MNLPLKAGESKASLRQSDVKAFLGCAYAFYLGKFEPEARKRPRGLRMGLGTAAHKALEENSTFKIETAADMPMADVLDVFSDAFDKEAKECEADADEVQELGGAAKVVGVAKDHGAAMVQLYRTEVAPATTPVLVEQSFRVELEGPYDVVGTIDMVDVVELPGAMRGTPVDFVPLGYRVRDAKFGTMTHDAEDWLQGDFYALGYSALHGGELPSGLQLDVYQRPTKRLPARYTAKPTTRAPEDTERALAIADVVHRAVEAEVFPPSGLGSWKCGPKYCDFWPCRYVRAVTPAEATVAEALQASIDRLKAGAS